MHETKSVSIPLAAHFKLSKLQMPSSESERREMSSIPYANIVGSIMYIMICTRPNVAHAISVASRYMSNHGKEHWNALKWILKYLKGSVDVGLHFGGGGWSRGDVALRGYCDSDYAANLDNMKSQSGYIFTLYGTTISWKPNLQSVVALSTTEAEYISLTEAAKEALWLQGILQDFDIQQDGVEILCDSNSTICLAKHQMFHERSKHVDVRRHFIRDEVKKGMIKVVKVPTEENASDMLTKALPVSKFKYCLDLVDVVKC